MTDNVPQHNFAISIGTLITWRLQLHNSNNKYDDEEYVYILIHIILLINIHKLAIKDFEFFVCFAYST